MFPSMAQRAKDDDISQRRLTLASRNTFEVMHIEHAAFSTLRYLWITGRLVSAFLAAISSMSSQVLSKGRVDERSIAKRLLVGPITQRTFDCEAAPCGSDNATHPPAIAGPALLNMEAAAAGDPARPLVKKPSTRRRSALELARPVERLDYRHCFQSDGAEHR